MSNAIEATLVSQATARPIIGAARAQSAREDALGVLSEILGCTGSDQIVARLRELARFANAAAEANSQADAVEFGTLRIEKDAHRVLVAGTEIALTAIEFRLLVTLVERRERVQGRETLLGDVWGMNPSSRTRTVDTHVRRLRLKLASAGKFIHTIRGVGYRFSEREPIRRRDGRAHASFGVTRLPVTSLAR
jgi:DNA-binding winged helix-turn-helix (wHTH) protein